MADNQAIEVIKAVGAIVTPIVLAWIAYLQIKLNKKQDEIRKDVDGKMSQLLEVTGAKERAEGKLAGKEEQRQDTISDKVVIAVEKSITEGDAKKVADTVVETVKADPEIEIKKS